MGPTNIEREALVILGERGWARFDCGVDHDGPLCLSGAIGHARRRIGYGQGPFDTYHADRAHVLAVIREQYPEAEGWAADSVMGWNDVPGRVVDEVVAVLEKAALRRDEEAA